ncbi:hypothetical protein DL96DRAFT_1269530 [Flagelloscypha sp. PMI_526]|nr:hypothetical protein DL96DRAFT_1269530 [Flagelloscypha sp. PMI_526]
MLHTIVPKYPCSVVVGQAMNLGQLACRCWLFSASVSEDTFASPDVRQVYGGMKAVPSVKGKILTITNYTGTTFILDPHISRRMQIGILTFPFSPYVMMFPLVAQKCTRWSESPYGCAQSLSENFLGPRHKQTGTSKMF